MYLAPATGLSKGVATTATVSEIVRPRLPDERGAGVRSERSWAMFHLVRLARPTDAPDRLILGGAVVSLLFVFVAETVPLLEKPAWAAIVLALFTSGSGLALKLYQIWDDRDRRKDIDRKETKAAEKRDTMLADTAKACEDMVRDARAQIARLEGAAQERLDDAQRRLAAVEKQIAEASKKRHEFAKDTQNVLSDHHNQILDQGEVVRGLQAEVERLKARLAVHEPPSVTIINNPQGGASAGEQG